MALLKISSLYVFLLGFLSSKTRFKRVLEYKTAVCFESHSIDNHFLENPLDPYKMSLAIIGVALLNNILCYFINVLLCLSLRCPEATAWSSKCPLQLPFLQTMCMVFVPWVDPKSEFCTWPLYAQLLCLSDRPSNQT